MTKLVLRTIFTLGLMFSASEVFAQDGTDVLSCIDNCDTKKEECSKACADDACRTKCETDSQGCLGTCK